MRRLFALSLLFVGVSALPAAAAGQCDQGSDQQRIACLDEKINTLASILMGEIGENGTSSGGFMLVNPGPTNSNLCMTSGSKESPASPKMQYCDPKQSNRVWVVVAKPK